MAKYFGGLINYLESLKRLNIDDLAFQIASTKELQDLVIELNTKDQLFDKGEDSTGRTLESIGGAYSPFTVSLKQAKGQPTNRITLFDTGDFYASFRIIPVKGQGFTIDSDTQKDDTNLIDEWGEDIEGLQDDNLQLVIDLFLDELLRKVNKEIKGI